jgi:hypothetical protein
MGDTMTAPNTFTQDNQKVLKAEQSGELKGKIDTPYEKQFLAERTLERFKKDPGLLKNAIRLASRDKKLSVSKIIVGSDNKEYDKQNVFEIFPNLKTQLSQIHKNRNNNTDVSNAAGKLTVHRQGDVVSITNNNTVAQTGTDAVAGS